MLGRDVVRKAAAVRRLIGLTGQFAPVDADLTAEENLLLLGHSRRRVARRDRARPTVRLGPVVGLGHARG